MNFGEKVDILLGGGCFGGGPARGGKILKVRSGKMLKVRRCVDNWCITSLLMMMVRCKRRHQTWRDLSARCAHTQLCFEVREHGVLAWRFSLNTLATMKWFEFQRVPTFTPQFLLLSLLSSSSMQIPTIQGKLHLSMGAVSSFSSQHETQQWSQGISHRPTIVLSKSRRLAKNLDSFEFFWP